MQIGLANEHYQKMALVIFNAWLPTTTVCPKSTFTLDFCYAINLF